MSYYNMRKNNNNYCMISRFAHFREENHFEIVGRTSASSRPFFLAWLDFPAEVQLMCNWCETMDEICWTKARSLIHNNNNKKCSPPSSPAELRNLIKIRYETQFFFRPKICEKIQKSDRSIGLGHSRYCCFPTTRYIFRARLVRVEPKGWPNSQSAFGVKRQTPTLNRRALQIVRTDHISSETITSLWYNIGKICFVASALSAVLLYYCCCTYTEIKQKNAPEIISSRMMCMQSLVKPTWKFCWWVGESVSVPQTCGTAFGGMYYLNTVATARVRLHTYDTRLYRYCYYILTTTVSIIRFNRNGRSEVRKSKIRLQAPSLVKWNGLLYE